MPIGRQAFQVLRQDRLTLAQVEPNDGVMQNLVTKVAFVVRPTWLLPFPKGCICSVQGDSHEPAHLKGTSPAEDGPFRRLLARRS